MKTKKLVIFGIEKMAELAHFYFSNDSEYEVKAFTVDEKYITNKKFLGLPVVSFENVEQLFPPDIFDMFVAIGYKKLNSLRAEKYMQAENKKYHLASYLSSKASHWGETQIGNNCFILENQVIQPFVKVGNNVIIWSGNHFGHNVVIEDHCWLSSHIVVSGGVTIGSYSFIGVNATIRDNVQIGRESIIGAGAIILNDVKEKSVYIAKPTELYPLDSARFEKMMEISR